MVGAPTAAAAAALLAAAPDEGLGAPLAAAAQTGGSAERGSVGRCHNEAIPFFSTYFCKTHYEEAIQNMTAYDGTSSTIRIYTTSLYHPLNGGSPGILDFWYPLSRMYYYYKCHAVRITVTFGFVNAAPAYPARVGIFGTVLPPTEWTAGSGQGYLPPAGVDGWDQSQIPHVTKTCSSHDADKPYESFSVLFRIKDMYGLTNLDDVGFTGETGADSTSPSDPVDFAFIGVWAEGLLATTLADLNVKFKLTYYTEWNTPATMYQSAYHGKPSGLEEVGDDDFDAAFDKMEVASAKSGMSVVPKAVATAVRPPPLYSRKPK